MAHFVPEEESDLVMAMLAQIEQRLRDEYEPTRKRIGVGHGGRHNRETELAARIVYGLHKPRTDVYNKLLAGAGRVARELPGELAGALSAVIALRLKRFGFSSGEPTPHPLSLPEGLPCASAKPGARTRQEFRAEEEQQSDNE